MSHFCVLVIGNDPEEQMAPYHEFECTGQDDEYVQDVDRTEESREEYLSRTCRQLKSPEGKLYDPWDDKFYRDPTPEEKEKIGPMAGAGCGHGLRWSSKDWGDGQGYRAKVHFTPEGYEEVEVPYKELMTFAKYLTDESDEERLVPFGETPDTSDPHKYGYILLGENGEVEKVVRRTNPNAKWDWFQVGGRWTGFFKLKAGGKGETGSQGLMTPRARDGWADSALLKDIDVEGIRADAEEKARVKYELMERLFGGSIPKIDILWDDLRTKEEYKDISIDEKRKMYHDQEALKTFAALRKEHHGNKEFEDLQFADLQDFQGSKEDYLEKARDSAFITFAVLKDGNWYERGEMGWWACVSNENKDWDKEFTRLVDGLPEDTLLTIVDCHI